MPQIKYVGSKPCSIMLIDGGYLGDIAPGKVIRVPIKDYDSLLDLAKRTHTPEWEKIEEEEK